jgi:alkylation response protein AidB-like acyl-CoA dehydrogenase
VDTRDTPEQAELRRSARQLARELGPATVADLDDASRAQRLAAAVRDAGWLELRADDGDGGALAGGVEACIVAEALGAAVADVGFTGAVLAGDLARRAGVGGGGSGVAAFAPSLADAAVVPTTTTTTELYAIDSGGAPDDTALVLVPAGAGYRLGEVRLDGAGDGAGDRAGDRDEPSRATDLTRGVKAIPVGTPVEAVDGQQRVLDDDDLASWCALGLALTSADLVGVMRGVLGITVEYAAQRRQFGATIGSFQAVQHLLADARCLMEGSLSAALHASWAVDDLAPSEARGAGRVAKAYSARAARTVCETAVQVHGGIGNTWECLVHVYLRRALLSSQWFGDDGEQLHALQRERLGVADGLS